MIRRLARALPALLAIAFFVGGQETKVLAAPTTGVISGTVVDSDLHPVSGVTVTAVAPSETESTVTKANGFYALTGLAPDTYLVTFSKAGYQPDQVAGVTVTQGQSVSVSPSMSAQPKTLATVAVRGVTSLVQPKTTADTYTATEQTVQEVTGTPQNISETGLLDALPGITTDTNGYPIIRGGAENEEGYELEGVDATDPITGQFINSLSLAGESRVVLSTGGYDVSSGNTNAGVVNEVIKRGAYPGAGEATASLNDPNYDHRMAFEWGNATPDNRFSYFFAFNGLRQFRVYGDPKVFEPLTVGAVGDASGNIDTANLFYRWGSNNENELQYMGETGFSAFYLDNGVNPKNTPYASNNKLLQLFFGGAVDLITPYPGQDAFNENTGFADNENNYHAIQKLNYKRQFGASSFGDLTLFQTREADFFQEPWRGGAFGDGFEDNGNLNSGISVDYTNQLNSVNEVSFGGETIYSKTDYINTAPSAALFVFTAVDPNTGFIPKAEGLINDPLHRSNLWIQDKITPGDRWTLQPGVRWDQEVLEIPKNAAAVNLSLAKDANGNTIEVPGQPLTSAVTRPSQVSPRFAVSYQAGSNDVFRVSYGKNIEFTPFSNIEFKWAGDALLQKDPIAPLPGFSPTCVGGFDPANGNARCNHITNLYALFNDEFNTNFFAQYTPVLPQTATNVDFSWEHQFPAGFQFKLTPYYRKGLDYVVANTPLLFNLNGVPVFGSPREENAGFNINSGVEVSLQKNSTFGWSGFIDATYDNTLANYNSDFFPSTNNAALALGHLFHVSYLAPVTGNLNLDLNTRSGWHIFNNFPFESGYRYGVGKDTFVFANKCDPSMPAVPMEVLNTDLAAGCNGLSANSSAYYFTDPTNPGTVFHPNITGSRGTPDGADPGTLHGPATMTWTMTIAHDLGKGPNSPQVGMRVENVLGNYTDEVIGSNGFYHNNGFGGYAPGSGINPDTAFEPYQVSFGPLPFESEPVGPTRTYTFYVSSKF